jgi:hypothetical protein
LQIDNVEPGALESDVEAASSAEKAKDFQSFPGLPKLMIVHWRFPELPSACVRLEHQSGTVA